MLIPERQARRFDPDGAYVRRHLGRDRDDRGLRLRSRLVPGDPAGGRGESGPRRPPAPGSARQRDAWANARRLQVALAEAGSATSTCASSTPTPSCAKRSTARTPGCGEGKRSRTVLAPIRPRLHQADPRPCRPRAIVRFIGKSRAALLCVERDAACHRSLSPPASPRTRIQGPRPHASQPISSAQRGLLPHRRAAGLRRRDPRLLRARVRHAGAAREAHRGPRAPHNFDLYKQMAELGWLGVTIPEEYGGSRRLDARRLPLHGGDLARARPDRRLRDDADRRRRDRRNSAPRSRRRRSSAGSPPARSRRSR